eukprot:8465655-Alexandrium_andersonii.AAC.1
MSAGCRRRGSGRSQSQLRHLIPGETLQAITPRPESKPLPRHLGPTAGCDCGGTCRGRGRPT